MKWLALIVLLIPCVSASVVISQVLYDPIGTESGGEAIELRNDGNESVNIGGWVLKTEYADADATIPDNTVLKPSETFLVADEGWDDNKDNSSWKSADYEEKITLGNTNGGIALIANGSIIDAAGWGDAGEIDDGLYEGDPASEVSAGMALLRTSDNDDNAEDFEEAEPSFQDGIFVPVTASVSFGSSPYLTVSKSLKLDPKGVLTIKNHASTAVDITLFLNDLRYKSFTISKKNIEVDTEFALDAGEEKNIEFVLRIPTDAAPGTYSSTLRVVYKFR
ncbi:MAG TPA: lamin tail domain-containing protein [Candidatus Nanoarchaeia archaeon]|nr:lamin tail domain-containing protein [Candidatus Nanoarchaeia archaeon]